MRRRSLHICLELLLAGVCYADRWVSSPKSSTVVEQQQSAAAERLSIPPLSQTSARVADRSSSFTDSTRDKPETEGDLARQLVDSAAQLIRTSKHSGSTGGASGTETAMRDKPFQPRDSTEFFQRYLKEDNSNNEEEGRKDGGNGEEDEPHDGGKAEEEKEGDDNEDDTANDDEDEAEEVRCEDADSCEGCKEIQLEDEERLCWWNGTDCESTERDAAHDVESMCTENRSAPSPAAKPSVTDPVPTDVSDGSNSTSLPTTSPVMSKSDPTPSPTAAPIAVSTPSPTSPPTPPPSPPPIPSPTSPPSPAPVEASPPKDNTPAPVTSAPVYPPTSSPVSSPPKTDDAAVDEPQTGSAAAVIFGVVLLVGVVLCLRRRSSTVGSFRGGAGGLADLMSPGVRSGQQHQPYQGVATNDDDEEWGWGDEEPQADVELSSKRYERESPRPPARKGMSLAGGGIGGLPKKSPPPVHKARAVVTSSSAVRRGGSRERDAYPSPRSSPSGGQNQTAKRPILPSAPFAGVASTPTASHPISPPPPTPASHPKQRADDIFAEMGLSAKPTFGKPAAAGNTRALPSAPSSGGASPWQQTASVSPSTHPLPAPHGGGRTTAAAAASSFSSSSVGVTPGQSPSSLLLRKPAIVDELAREAADSSNQQWDDDADLDDLLND